ncbi:MAG: transporter permease [Herminiimonas sp.]|nr:transporter permease [Herminiimonas sp.]MDB5854025.1 transporter permease [Herminiimonas sp.]
MVMGTWAGRIPAVRDSLGISPSVLSFVLLCGGLGAVISFPLSSWMMRTLGGTRTILLAGMPLLAALACIGIAPTVPALMGAVLIFGVTASCFDVGVNSVATQVEKATGKASLSKLHGCWGAGALAGAALGSVMAGAGVSAATHLIGVAVALAFLLWLGHSLLEDGGRDDVDAKKGLSIPRGPVAWLGALGFFGALSEGGIADWSGVFLKDHFNVGDGVAPLALAAFSGMMLIARLGGDRLKMRFGARPLVTLGAVLSAAGLLLAAFAPTSTASIAGFGVAGLGLSVVFPYVFSAAGRHGPAALAGVATMSYTGSLMGPPLVGSIAHNFGIQGAVAFIALFSAAIAAIARKTVMLDQ